MQTLDGILIFLFIFLWIAFFDPRKFDKYFGVSTGLHYRNITTKYISFLTGGANKPNFGYNMFVQGMIGSGKTVWAAEHMVMLLDSDKKRHCKIFQADGLYAEIMAQLPEKYKKRLSLIQHLREVKPHDVLWIDEGGLSANGKEALKVEMRIFGKSVRKTRQMRIMVILLCQDDSVIADFRKNCQILVYLCMTDTMPALARADPILFKHSKKIGKLEYGEALVKVKVMDKSQRMFGIVKLSLKKICPWWTEQISHYMRKGSFDAEYEKEEKEQLKIHEIAELAITELGEDAVTGRSAGAILRGWLHADHLDLYHDFRTKIPMIIDDAKYELFKNSVGGSASLGPADAAAAARSQQGTVLLTSNYSSLGDFVRQYLTIRGTNFFKSKHPAPLEHDVVSQWINSEDQRSIASNLSVALKDVNKIGKFFWGKVSEAPKPGEKFAPVEYQAWNLYELYQCALLGAQHLGGDSHDPDGILPDSRALACKFFKRKQQTHTLYQSIHLGPEHDYAVLHHQDSFRLAFRCLEWGSFDVYKTVYVNGDDRVLVKADDADPELNAPWINPDMPPEKVELSPSEWAEVDRAALMVQLLGKDGLLESMRKMAAAEPATRNSIAKMLSGLAERGVIEKEDLDKLLDEI